jgi:hypothetical protein
MRTSFHHQPEAQHPNFQLFTSWQADYPIYRRYKRTLLRGRWLDAIRGVPAPFHHLSFLRIQSSTERLTYS